MKKIVRLTENDLTRIVKKVLNEQMNRTPFENWLDDNGATSSKIFDYIKQKKGFESNSQLKASGYRPLVYTVRKGDTIEELERIHGEKFDKNLNPHIDDINTIYPGDEIVFWDEK
jgi:hypothetical protein